MENEKNMIDVEESDIAIEVPDEDWGGKVDTTKPNIFKRAWNGVKGFPKKHPKITTGLVGIGAMTLGYLLGQKFKTSDDTDDGDNYDELKLFDGPDTDSGDETEDEDFSFSEVDNEEEAV